MKIRAAIIAVLISSTASAAEPVKVQPPANKILSSENGRYVYGQVSEMRRDQYMLDTRTGKLWNINTTITGIGEDRQEKLILVPILYKQQDGALSSEPK